MSRRIELLAPAGDMKAFKAAIENGADAVYLGGKQFNAREYAGNFDSSQLKEAIDYAHVRGANVYLTMNILISEDEIEQAVECVKDAWLAGVDGLIVQDLGFASIIRRLFPDLSLHASTQMTIYDLQGVQMLEKLGFKRVVLARELPLKEIRHIAGSTSLELEVFVHGALCVSYSGQCLMSSIIGGRSGNRGKCAQPCRLPYKLIEIMNKGKGNTDRLYKEKAIKSCGRYLLSPKDICLLPELDSLIASGVSSLKIEGRMKNPEYVATVVRIYRKYVDNIIKNADADTDIDAEVEVDVDKNIDIGSEKSSRFSVDAGDIKELSQIFNRGGFTRGYFRDKLGRDMMSYEKPKNWGLYLGVVEGYDTKRSAVTLKIEEDLGIGDGIEVWNGENESPSTVVTGMWMRGGRVQSSPKGSVVTVSSIKGRIAKGDRVYKTSDSALGKRAKETFEGSFLRKVFLNCTVEIKSGREMRITAIDDMGHRVTIDSGYIPEPAINRAITEEMVIKQLDKTGSTPFLFADINVKMDEDLSIPLSRLNELRRRALKEMELQRQNKYHRKIDGEYVDNKKRIFHFPGNARRNTKNLHVERLKTAVFFYKWREDAILRELKADRLYLPVADLLNAEKREIAKAYRSKGTEVFTWLPAITRGKYHEVIPTALKAAERLIDGVLVGNLGSIGSVSRLGHLKIMGDYPLNVFNGFSEKELVDAGLCGITLSPELTMQQINHFRAGAELQREVMAYGRIPVMTSEYCPVGSICGGLAEGSKCSKACIGRSFALKDRKQIKFPILCDRVDCRSIILNSNVLFIADEFDRLETNAVDILRLNITDETADEVQGLIELHNDLAAGGADVLQKHKALISNIKAAGFTRGHYFRGV